MLNATVALDQKSSLVSSPRTKGKSERTSKSSSILDLHTFLRRGAIVQCRPTSHVGQYACILESKLPRRSSITHGRVKYPRYVLRLLVRHLRCRRKLSRDEGRSIANDEDVLVDAVVLPDSVEVVVDFEAVLGG